MLSRSDRLGHAVVAAALVAAATRCLANPETRLRVRRQAKILPSLHSDDQIPTRRFIPVKSQTAGAP